MSADLLHSRLGPYSGQPVLLLVVTKAHVQETHLQPVHATLPGQLRPLHKVPSGGGDLVAFPCSRRFAAKDGTDLHFNGIQHHYWTTSVPR